MVWLVSRYINMYGPGSEVGIGGIGGIAYDKMIIRASCCRASCMAMPKSWAMTGEVSASDVRELAAGQSSTGWLNGGYSCMPWAQS